MLKNAYLDAKIGVDPAENEPPEECCVAGKPADAARRARGEGGILVCHPFQLPLQAVDCDIVVTLV